MADQAVRLARRMGIAEDVLIQMRWGAMLHDIGKIGVPDQILAKAGPLDDAEWRVMRRHPTMAYEMLQPLDFFGPALEIPYCHHEHWDGSGYPRGLKGEEIPATARIFSVVDVWDALTHDRPYRAAWPQNRVRAHIRAAAGKDLDPTRSRSSWRRTRFDWPVRSPKGRPALRFRRNQCKRDTRHIDPRNDLL